MSGGIPEGIPTAPDGGSNATGGNDDGGSEGSSEGGEGDQLTKVDQPVEPGKIDHNKQSWDCQGANMII